MEKKNLQRLQLTRLKRLLRYAYEKIPYYHKSFRKRGFRPCDLKSLEEIRRIPVLRKSDIRSNLRELVSADSPRMGSELCTTSGTTATPLRFHRGKTDLSWARGAEFRAYGWGGYRLGDKIALLWGFAPEQTRSFGFKIYSLLARRQILNVNCMSRESMFSFAKRLERFSPRFVRGYSGATNVFASFLLENPQVNIRPETVFTSAATLLPHQRKTIEKAFDCRVHDFYGSREISAIASQCGQHEGLHVSDENVVLEILKDNQPVSSGEDGRILLTNLHSDVMPFIRYDIGDVGRSFPDECQCGRHLSLVKPFGRTYEYFLNSDGSFTSLRDVQQVFEDIPVVDFQIIQESHDEIVVRIVAGPGYTRAHSDFIEKNIRFRGKATIRVEIVSEIPREKSGKILHIVTRLPRR